MSEADAIAEVIHKTAAGFWSLYGQADTDGTDRRAPRIARSGRRSTAPQLDANPWGWVVELRSIGR